MVFSPCRHFIHSKVQPVDITPVISSTEIKFGIAVLEHLFTESRAIVFECIGPKVEPDKKKRVGRMIGILNAFKSIQTLILVVEFYRNFVLQFLLPISGLRRCGK